MYPSLNQEYKKEIKIYLSTIYRVATCARWCITSLRYNLFRTNHLTLPFTPKHRLIQVRVFLVGISTVCGFWWVFCVSWAMNNDWSYDWYYGCCLGSMLSPRGSRPPWIRFGRFWLPGSRAEKWRNFYAPRNASGPFPMLEKRRERREMKRY